MRRARSSVAGFVVTAALAVGAFEIADESQGATLRTTGTLELRAALRLVSNQLDCPLPTTTAAVCAGRTSTGLVPGLGSVKASYAFLADFDGPPCGSRRGRALAYPVSLVVAGKGTINFALAEAACVGEAELRVQAQSFTVTGGTGIYASASGSGTVERTLGGQVAVGRVGIERWRGTLVVPEVDFDIVRPTISGAVAKTVRAPRGVRTARVRFTVTARDAVDGARPTTCKPRSGSRFRIGTTRVTCSATDTSGNAAGARFTVTVRTTQ